MGLSQVTDLLFPGQVEEVPGDFTQSDLATDDVMLLDTWDQVTELQALLSNSGEKIRTDGIKMIKWE